MKPQSVASLLVSCAASVLFSTAPALALDHRSPSHDARAAQRQCPPSRQMPNGMCCPRGQAWLPSMNTCMAVGMSDGCPPGQHNSSGRCCGNGEEFDPSQNTCVCVQPGGCYGAPVAQPVYPQPQQPAYPQQMYPQQPGYPQQGYPQPAYPQPAYPQQPGYPQPGYPQQPAPGGIVQTQVGACYGGDADACVDAAVALRDGNQVARDEAQSVALLRRACGQNYARACSVLGFAFERGRGVPADLGQARVHYERACQGNYAGACNNLAILYSEGRGVPRDPARAAQLYQRACQGGDANACNFAQQAQQQAQVQVQQQRAQTSDACLTLRVMQRMASMVNDNATAQSIAPREQVACRMGGEIGDESWPNGLSMHYASSNNWSYPNGLTARYGASNNWSYPNGLTMVFGASGNWAYPNGLTMLFGSTRTYALPNGMNSSEQGLITWACQRMDPGRCAQQTQQISGAQGFWRNMLLLEMVWSVNGR